MVKPASYSWFDAADGIPVVWANDEQTGCVEIPFHFYYFGTEYKRINIASDGWASFDDCYDSLLWARQSAQELAIDPRRIVVGGDSAGGALAAGVAQKALDQGEELSGQMLVYPVTDSRCNTQSVQDFDDAPLWNSISTRRMWQAYLPGGDHQQPPEYAAPGLRQDLGGLPSAYVETAEFDPLRDEGEHYARALQAAGVSVEMNATQGTIHGYELAAENPIVKDAMDRRCAFLSACFQRRDSIDSTGSEA